MRSGEFANSVNLTDAHEPTQVVSDIQKLGLVKQLVQKFLYLHFIQHHKKKK